jgi:hypothetical protein
MEINKSAQLAKEISAKIGTKEYHGIILKLIRRIRKGGEFEISSCYSCPASMIVTDPKGETNTHIRLKLNKDIVKSENIIWDILHEYGHCLSGIPKIPSIIREIEAWHKAYIILLKYPELQIMEKSFFDYQKSCLETYYFNDFCSKLPDRNY